MTLISSVDGADRNKSFDSRMRDVYQRYSSLCVLVPAGGKGEVCADESGALGSFRVRVDAAKDAVKVRSRCYK